MQAGSITVLTTAIPGVDTVTNASAFINGIDAETDAALPVALRALPGLALEGDQSGRRLRGHQRAAGAESTRSPRIRTMTAPTTPGYFYVVVDDGTGYPSTTLLTNVGNAIDAVRAAGQHASASSPRRSRPPTSAMTITTASGYTHADVVAAVAAALTNFINGLPLGTGLPYTQLASVAYERAGRDNATGILLNSGTPTWRPTSKQKIARRNYDDQPRWPPATHNDIVAPHQGAPAERLVPRRDAGARRGPVGHRRRRSPSVYGLTAYARLQTRIATATDGFLDLISFDFFGRRCPGKPQESDAAFRVAHPGRTPAGTRHPQAA